jgi:hypothetical protein
MLIKKIEIFSKVFSKFKPPFSSRPLGSLVSLFFYFRPLLSHYKYNAVPDQYAGGPVPDETKKSYCYEDLCREDVQNLRACVNYKIDFRAHRYENETMDANLYSDLSFKTLEEGNCVA